MLFYFLENAFLVKCYCLDVYNILSFCDSCDKPAAKQHFVCKYFSIAYLLSVKIVCATTASVASNKFFLCQSAVTVKCVGKGEHLSSVITGGRLLVKILETETHH